MDTQMGPSAGRPPAVDARPQARPGVPMEHAPRPAEGVHWEVLERQQPRGVVLKRAGLDRLTPVFGTGQPPRGLSGLLRRAAYRIPDHKASHWAVLMLADRVDVVESGFTDTVQRRPLLSAGIGLGLVVLTTALLRARR